MVDKAAPKTVFTCQQCGHATPRWMGQCPGCGEWNTLVEEVVRDAKSRGRRATGPSGGGPTSLAAVTAGAAIRRTTGIGELDRVLGGGLVREGTGRSLHVLPRQVAS